MADEEKNEQIEEEAQPEAEAPAEEPQAEAEEPQAEADAPGEVAEEAPPADAGPDEEPAAEEAPEPEAEAEAEAAPQGEVAAEEVEEAEEAPAPEPPRKPKRKRLPRSQRRQRPKVTRERPAERRPIVRVPRPERVPGRRQERRGVVVSDAMDKTIVVRVEQLKMHPQYKKVIRRATKFHAHDEQNQAKVGDVVLIVETRPLSRTKCWRLAEIVEVAQ
jgi:small subunit ribosomal protein S17